MASEYDKSDMITEAQLPSPSWWDLTPPAFRACNELRTPVAHRNEQLHLRVTQGRRRQPTSNQR